MGKGRKTEEIGEKRDERGERKERKKIREIYVTIHKGAKFCLLETLLFYFSKSVDFGENK